MTRGGPAAALVAFAVALPAGAQKPEVDPDAPETHAKAREALARAQRSELKGETRQIVGLRSGIEGRTQDLAGLLKDLNAEVRGQEVRIALSADVLFDFDKADLRPEARPELEKLAAVIKSYPGSAVRIEGHTDGKGEAAYNKRLSERRAESVRKWLSASGVGSQMSTRGWGKDKPVAANTRPDGKDDPEGRQKNRRVEVTVTRRKAAR